MSDQGQRKDFVVATRRAVRGTGPSAAELVGPRPDIRIKGDTPNPDRVVVEATEEAAEQLRRDHGDRLMVEGAVPRFPL
jgi:hypothetical protein